MRFNRGTFVLVLVSVVVIVVVLLLNGNQASAPDASATPTASAASGPLFPDATQDNVTRLEVRDNSTDKYTVMEKVADQTWAISEASNTSDLLTDQSKATDLISKVVALKSTDSFGPDNVEGFNLADYGLDQPAYTATVTLDNGTTYTLYVGKKNPGSTRYYVQVASAPSAEATAEATVEATAEVTAAPGGSTVYLVLRSEIDNVTAAVSAPPYVPSPTPTQTAYPTPNPYSEVQQTATAAVEQTATAEATPEVTAEATGEATAEATMEATPEATASP